MILLRSLLIAATLSASLVLVAETAAQQGGSSTAQYSAQYDNWKYRVLGGPAGADPYVQRLWSGGYNPYYWLGPTPVGNGYFYPPANYPYRFWHLPYRDVPAP